MPFIILGGIYGGIMTPTEAAAVAFVCYSGGPFHLLRPYYSRPVGSHCRGLPPLPSCHGHVFPGHDYEPPADYGKYSLTKFGALLSITDNKYIILIMVNLFMIIIGMLMDDVSDILLCTPILLPIVTGVGVHPVHFAAILGVNLV